MSQRVRPELFAEQIDRRAHALHRHTFVSKLSEQARFNKLAPGHRISARALRTKHRLVELASSGVAIEPSQRCTRVHTDQPVDI
jgi:hypothetical protein